MTPFVFNTTPSIRMGAGEIENLGNISSAICSSCALIVTDAGMVRTVWSLRPMLMSWLTRLKLW